MAPVRAGFTATLAMDGMTRANKTLRAYVRRYTRFLRHLAACSAVIVTPLSGLAFAADYPSKAITIVVPFPAGAGVDLTARLLAEQLAIRLGRPTVVENRPGASGLVGAAAVARAAPDGYTLLMTPNTLFIAPYVMPAGEKPPVDVINDFESVVMPSQTTMVMVANPGLGVTDAKQLADLARKEPGKITYGSSGNGSVLQIAGELFNQSAHVDIRHVPFRGIIPAIANVLGGYVNVTFSGIGPVRGYLQSNTLVALATVEDKRSAAMPELPTAIEQGFPDVAVDGWYALLAPKGTPREIVDRLNHEVNTVLDVPEIRERIVLIGDLALGGTPEEAKKRIMHDYDRYGAIVSRLKITSD
jgi:tripartite-type tricarboxylate transporter receptor subunit TctC